MAQDIQPKDATAATVAMSCLVGATAFVLISSVYLTHNTGWPQLALSAFCAAAVCAVGASALGYAAYQQFVVKRSLFADHDDEFEYRSIGQWAVVTGATDGIGKEYARQVSNGAGDGSDDGGSGGDGRGDATDDGAEATMASSARNIRA